jgi:NhaP-type Na+/H+ or K+/H+ antiporter
MHMVAALGAFALGSAFWGAASDIIGLSPTLYVAAALMGAGLKLDRAFSWRKWGVTWRLLAVTMPLSIAAITLIGGLGLGLSWVAALLLGASLAPTDPVLAADVQVGPPKSGEEDEVRFGLTSEAGLNDGLAFPFVNLAIALGVAFGAAVVFEMIAEMEARGEAGKRAEILGPGVVVVGEAVPDIVRHMAVGAEGAEVKQLQGRCQRGKPV